MSLRIRLQRAGMPLLAVLFVISTLIFYGSVNAQTSSDAITIGVSPQLLEVTANPGEVITNTFRLTNASLQPLVIKTTPKNFTPNGEEGAVNLTEDNTTYAISTWTTVSPATATVQSNKTQDFKVTINVPPNVEPGSHFGSVVFQTVPPENDEAAALVSQEIAPVILVKIAGATIESTEIVEFKSDETFYSNQNTIELISRIKNTGNVHFKPTGQIVIKNMFGSEVAKFELDKNNILPDSIRQFTNEWQLDGFKLGSYTAELTLVTGEDNSIQTASTTFSIFPYQTILPVILGLLVIGFIIFKGRKRLILAAKALSGNDTNKSK